MKTIFALLLLLDGRPCMTLQEIADLRGIDFRTAQNMAHDGSLGIPVWKDGSQWFAHVEDVANWIDEQRAQAAAQLEQIRSQLNSTALSPSRKAKPAVEDSAPAKVQSFGLYLGTAYIAAMLGYKRAMSPIKSSSVQTSRRLAAACLRRQAVATMWRSG